MSCQSNLVCFKRLKWRTTEENTRDCSDLHIALVYTNPYTQIHGSEGCREQEEEEKEQKREKEMRVKRAEQRRGREGRGGEGTGGEGRKREEREKGGRVVENFFNLQY